MDRPSEAFNRRIIDQLESTSKRRLNLMPTGTFGPGEESPLKTIKAQPMPLHEEVQQMRAQVALGGSSGVMPDSDEFKESVGYLLNTVKQQALGGEPSPAEDYAVDATEALHYDKGKARVDLVPPESIQAIAEVLGYGASKYAERNWELGGEWMRYYASAMRHMLAWSARIDIDPESGLNHLSHALTNLAFLVTWQARAKGTDNRPIVVRDRVMPLQGGKLAGIDEAEQSDNS